MFEPPRDPSRAEQPPAVPAVDPPSAPPATNDWKRRAGGAVVAIGLAAAKFKGLLYFVGHAKVLLSALSLLLSVWFYTQLFGLKYAIGFVLLIAIHEVGHVFMIRSAGLPGGTPYFIPGMGAFTTLGARPASAYQSAWIAFGGPLFGAAGAALCFGYGVLTEAPFWTALAWTGFFLNFLNLLPVPPFDGGRIVEAVSPRIWVFGLVLLGIAVVTLHLWQNPLIIVLLVLSIPQIFRAWRGQDDPAYHDLTTAQRAIVACAYFALAGALYGLMTISYTAPPGHATST